MLRNYLLISLRNIKKQRGYAFINIFGLAMGIACCILIFTFIRYELSYDSFHKYQKSLFRLVRVTKDQGGETDSIAIHPLPLGPALREEIPEISSAVRLITGNGLVSSGDRVFDEQLLFADPDFFDVFTFPFLEGDSSRAFESLNSIILTDEMAGKYFGEKEPLGESLTFELGGERRDLIVTGIAAKIPLNSSIRFDFVLPYAQYPGYREAMNNWRSSRTRTYVQLEENAHSQALENKLSGFVDKHFGDVIRNRQQSGYLSKDDGAWQLQLEPIRSVHLNPKVRWGMGTPRNPASITILSGLAFLVLLVACINFITLAVARSASRTKEVGIRKVLGAARRQITIQFLGESLLLILFALFLGTMLAELFLPTFNSLTGTNLTIGYGLNLSLLFSIFGLLLLLCIGAGGYPALYLSGFQPSLALRERLKIRGKSLLSRSLVILQYSLSIFLVISTLVMWAQLHYMRNKHLGYDKEEVLSIWTYPGGQENEGERILEFFRNELAGDPRIPSVSGTSDSFTQGWSIEGWEYEGKPIDAFVYRIDSEYFQTLGIELKEGRNFSSQFQTDAEGAVIVNEAMIRELGGTSGVGQKLHGFANVGGMTNPLIIGVVKDFHFESLHREIEPVVLHINPIWPINTIMARVRGDKKSSVIGLLEQIWEKAAFQKPFEYHFMSEDVDNQYNEDRRWSRIVSFSSLLAIVISCFGLFGLTSLRVAQRTKEIGIRKVVGASVLRIVRLINLEFLKLVALANILAWPLAYYVMNRWIQNFAYRISIEIWTFFLAAALALIIALLTVSLQSLKAALVNPVDTLRYE